MALLSFVVLVSFFVPLFSYCSDEKTLIKFFRLLQSFSLFPTETARRAVQEECHNNSFCLWKQAFKQNNNVLSFSTLTPKAVTSLALPQCTSRWAKVSHLCRHAMNARLRSDRRRHLSSTPHDDPMQQLPYHRSHNEHWLQSLHSKKCRIIELFSTAFRICRCNSYKRYQLCWMNEF